MPTYVFAAEMAATVTVVPKSSSESIVFPFHEALIPAYQRRYDMKKTTADWYNPSPAYSQNFMRVYSRPRLTQT